MPSRSYAKKPFYSRRKFPRTRKGAWYNKRYSAIDMGKMALSQIWKLKGLVNSEMYKLDTAISGQNIDGASPYITHLTAVGQGDGDNQRSGNSIFVRSFNFKGAISRTASGDAAQVIRLSVIQDIQQVSDTTPTVTDVYEGTSPYAHLNSATVGRYKVLWSRTYTLDTANRLVTAVQINLPMRHHVRYNGTGTTDVQKGGLYMIASSSQATNHFPAINGEYRLSYHDN